MKIGDYLYCYPWQSMAVNNCNSYFIAGSVPLLIDPGHLQHLPSLVQRLEKDGFKKDSIALIVNTHAHPDHCEGMLGFPRGKTLVAFHQDEDKFMFEYGPDFFRAFGQKMPDFWVDFDLQEGDLCVGKHLVQVLHTPGHSPGSISLYFPALKALFSGDLIFAGGVGITDVPGGDFERLISSIEKIAQLEIDILLPGHGEILRGREKVLRNFDYISQVLGF